MPKLTSDTMLSCSQLPSLFGVSPYSTPNDTLTFCCKSITGEDARFKAGEAADWGNALEPAILKEMANRLKLWTLIMPETAYKHPTLPIAASADALGSVEQVGYPNENDSIVIQHDPSKGIYVMDGDSIELKGMGVLESKLTRGHPEDSLPLYRGPIQAQGVMMCTGLQWAAIGCLYSGVELRIYLFKTHQSTQDQITVMAEEFEQKLEHFRQTGEVDYYPASNSKDADRIWPYAKDTEVVLSEHAEYLAQEIVMAKQNIKEQESHIDICEKDLKALMQDATVGKAGGYTIKWPMRHFKESAEKITPAKAAYSIRQSTLTIKESK